MAELADAYGSGPYGGNPMKVQVLSPAPLKTWGQEFAPDLFYFTEYAAYRTKSVSHLGASAQVDAPFSFV